MRKNRALVSDVVGESPNVLLARHPTAVVILNGAQQEVLGSVSVHVDGAEDGTAAEGFERPGHLANQVRVPVPNAQEYGDVLPGVRRIPQSVGVPQDKNAFRVFGGEIGPVG